MISVISSVARGLNVAGFIFKAVVSATNALIYLSAKSATLTFYFRACLMILSSTSVKLEIYFTS